MGRNDQMQQLADCIKSDDWDCANRILQEIWDRKPTYDEVRALLTLLTDDYEDIGVMYGIVHASESIAPIELYRALAAVLPHLIVRSPKWARFILARHLAAVAGQPTGHDPIKFLDVVATSLTSDSQSDIREALRELKLSGKFNIALSHHLIE